MAAGPAALAECPQARTVPPTNDLSILFNNMILPFEGIRFKAIVWYQVKHNHSMMIPQNAGTAC